MIRRLPLAGPRTGYACTINPIDPALLPPTIDHAFDYRWFAVTPFSAKRLRMNGMASLGRV